MSRRRPDPDQALFRWVWSAPEDDRPDRPEDDIDDDDDAPPLRERVRDHREGVANVTLWGEPLTVRRAPSGAYDRSHERRMKG